MIGLFKRWFGRERVDAANGRKCAMNRLLLAEAVRLRHECAVLLGYADHVAFSLEDKMAKEPGCELAFLESLRTRLVGPACQELARLTELKATHQQQQLEKVLMNLHILVKFQV